VKLTLELPDGAYDAFAAAGRPVPVAVPVTDVEVRQADGALATGARCSYAEALSSRAARDLGLAPPVIRLYLEAATDEKEE
jgi:hypothetical protein